MRNSTILSPILFVTMVVVGAACSDASGGQTSSLPGASEPAGNAVTIFEDDFDDDGHGWGGPFQTFRDGFYVWSMPPGQRDSRAADTLIAREDELASLTITTVFTARDMLGVGIECAYEELEGSSRWYNLELGHEGVTILKRPPGEGPAEILGTNPDVTLTDKETELAATCVLEDDSYLLRVTVDGTTALEVTDDDPFGRAGAPNLAVRAAPNTESAEVRFDRFTVTAAP